MSKPVTRRHFLLGKFLGILLACLALTCLLGWCLNWTMHVKPFMERLDDATDPLAQQMQAVLAPAVGKAALTAEAAPFVAGVHAWLGEALARGLGLVLGFGQVMVLL